jgi:EpsI family protein
VLGLDDYLLRRFSATNGTALTLYVAYYGHQRLDGRIHSPSACLPAGGWLPVDVGYQEIAIPGDPSTRMSVNRFLIEKGTDRQVVLYWFQGRGRVVANDIQATLFLAYDTLRGRGSDETLVRVSAPVGRSPHDILAEEVRFVQHFYPQLRRFFVSS